MITHDPEFSSDSNYEVLADLFAMVASAILVLFLIAVTAMGVPEVKLSALEAESERANAAEEAAAASDRHAKSLASDVASEKNRADSATARANDAQGRAKELAASRENERNRANTAENALGNATERANRESRRADAAEGALQPRPITVVVLQDVTNSQEPVLAQYRDSLPFIAEVGAMAASPHAFRFSLIRYWSQTDGMPLTTITSSETCSGMRTLRHYLKSRTVIADEVQGGRGEKGWRRTGRKAQFKWFSTTVDERASVLSALAAANQTLSAVKDDSVKVVLLCGDAIEDAGSVLRHVQQCESWAKYFRNQGWHLHVSFTGDRAFPDRHRERSRRYFKRIATAAGNFGSYSESPEKIAAVLLTAILRPRARVAR